MKKFLIAIAFVLSSFSLFAQQDLALSQQFFSRINKNPAGVGNISDIDAFLLGRYQWADMKDSPKSGVFNIQKFKPEINSGFGFSMSYDDLGVAKRMFNPKLVYAYNLKLKDELLLSLGLSAGVQYGYFDATQYILEDMTEIDDGDFPDSKETQVRPDFDFGAELVSPEFLIGFSITHLSESEATTLQADRHFYLYGRYIFTVAPQWDIAPALTWMHKNDVNVTELNCTAFYGRLFWFGLTYHPDLNDTFGTNPLAVNLGLEFDNFRIGYTFDYNFGTVSHYSKTAHELMLSYSFRNKNAGPKSDRFE